MAARSRNNWHQLAEVGSLVALRIGARFYRLFGRRATHWILSPITAYFVLRHRRVRAASREFLSAVERTRGQSPREISLPAVYRHVHEFAVNLFDRMLLWGGSIDLFEIEKEGSRALLDLARAGRGGILVGAHLGSFDVLRLVAEEHRVTVNVLMFTDHAPQINAFFERLDPDTTVRVMNLDPNSVNAAFAVRSCIERGEFVAILADRVQPGGRERPLTLPFLGRPARFPSTPFLLATLLGCPLLLALGLRSGEGRYETIAHVLSPGRRVARGERDKAARELLLHYVAELERHCLRYPEQWFNYYDFWDAPGA